ncbi:RDD family protein [Candidatus Poriferisocius sp.]|uniref:RDD family protein n=1 Tax=Candidatus Poriferisocius sp. TaxID=3101276 RepID=UPI003B013602
MDQPQPPEPRDDTSSVRSGRGRKAPVKRVVLDTGETMVLAGYVQRLCARIADTLVFGIAFAVLWQVNDRAYRLDFYLLVLAALLILMINEVVLVTCCGRTLGMQILGIRLVSKKTGKKPSMIASFFRWALQIFWCLFAFGENRRDLADGAAALGWIFVVNIPWWLLVHLSVYFGKGRRGWHDLISGTVVVTADPPRPADPLGGDTA